jgi:hypothetical protein
MNLLSGGANGSAIPTAEICAAFEAGLGERSGRSRRVVRCDRRPFAFETSAPLQELDLVLEDGEQLAVLFKQVGANDVIEASRGIRPAFLLDSNREIEAYRRVLPRLAEGTPTCYATVVEPERLRYWLFLERVNASHLWEFRDLEVWCAAARWAARFHQRSMTERGPWSHAGAPLVHDAAYYRTWAQRAWRFVSAAEQERPARLRRLERLLARHDAVVTHLQQIPRTLVHGEFFASNVLIATTSDDGRAPGRRVCPVDWEGLGVAPGVTDLTTIAAGWEGDDRLQIVQAYFDEQRESGWYSSIGELLEALDVCHLQLAIQMMGWSESWSPPREHRLDWLKEALDAARRLGILSGSSD